MASVLKLKGFEDTAGWTKSPAPPACLRLRGHEPHQDLVVCVGPGRSSKIKRKNALAAAQAARCLRACILTHSTMQWKYMTLCTHLAFTYWKQGKGAITTSMKFVVHS